MNIPVQIVKEKEMRRLKDMIKTTIEWYTPEERKPESSEALTMFKKKYDVDVSHITVLSVYDGHYNCYSRNTDHELFPDYWAEIPCFDEKESEDDA